ncbi:MAG: hypothetical protein ACOY9D_11955 [Pseudomonadota bacterium]
MNIAIKNIIFIILVFVVYSANVNSAPLIIAGNSHHILILKTDGSLITWGDNTSGQMGDGTLVTRTEPITVQGLSDVISIAAATLHSLAVRSDGTVWQWGNPLSQLAILCFLSKWPD